MKMDQGMIGNGTIEYWRDQAHYAHAQWKIYEGLCHALDESANRLGQERDAQIEQNIQLSKSEDELLDALEDMVWQHCYQRDDDSFDSGALTANASALRLLAKHNRFEIKSEYGRMVVGKFIEEVEND